jgi:hypothetical protein
LTGPIDQFDGLGSQDHYERLGGLTNLSFEYVTCNLVEISFRVHLFSFVTQHVYLLCFTWLFGGFIKAISGLASTKKKKEAEPVMPPL